MNIVGRMDLMEALAAEYALGTLRGGARRRLEALAEESSALRELIRAWKVRLDGLGELCPAQKPSVGVWASIEAKRVDASHRAHQGNASLQGNCGGRVLRKASVKERNECKGE